MNLKLTKIGGDYWIAQLDNLDETLTADLSENSSDFWTISQTANEISLVSKIESHSSFQKVEGPWCLFGILGTLDFSLTGILSKCSSLLANSSVSVFAISTFDTDYFLVRKESADVAVAAWQSGGINFD